MISLSNSNKWMWRILRDASRVTLTWRGTLLSVAKSIIHSFELRPRSTIALPPLIVITKGSTSSVPASDFPARSCRGWSSFDHQNSFKCSDSVQLKTDLGVLKFRNCIGVRKFWHPECHLTISWNAANVTNKSYGYAKENPLQAPLDNFSFPSMRIEWN